MFAVASPAEACSHCYVEHVSRWSIAHLQHYSSMSAVYSSLCWACQHLDEAACQRIMLKQHVSSMPKQQTLKTAPQL